MFFSKDSVIFEILDILGLGICMTLLAACLLSLDWKAPWQKHVLGPMDSCIFPDPFSSSHRMYRISSSRISFRPNQFPAIPTYAVGHSLHRVDRVSYPISNWRHPPACHLLSQFTMLTIRQTQNLHKPSFSHYRPIRCRIISLLLTLVFSSFFEDEE